MNATKSTSLFVVASFVAMAMAQAQTPPPDNGAAADPSAASTPHQRDATGRMATESPTSGSPEASAASSPHQHDATMSKGDKMGKGDDKKLKMASKAGAEPASFVSHAAQTGLTEIELGKVALNKSQDPAVRKFAERMVQDHGKANTELTTIAKRKNLDVPASLDSEHQSMVQSVSAKSGAAFDAAYSEHMAMGHSQALALFESASKSSDADLSAFASKTLPTLKEHKKMADALPAVRSASAGTETPKR